MARNWRPSLPQEYPRQDVADHEVLMSFNGDSEAILFRDWWFEVGEEAFGKWLAQKEAKAND